MAETTKPRHSASSDSSSSLFDDLGDIFSSKSPSTCLSCDALDATKEYLGRVVRGEFAEETLNRYNDLLERSAAGDREATSELINEFAGGGGIAKAGKIVKGVKNGQVVGDLKGLTLAEREFVDELVSQGKQVEIIPRGSGKTADFLIDGVETELKTVNRLGANTVKNAIQSASKQGENILIDARGTSLTKADALKPNKQSTR